MCLEKSERAILRHVKRSEDCAIEVIEENIDFYKKMSFEARKRDFPEKFKLTMFHLFLYIEILEARLDFEKSFLKKKKIIDFQTYFCLRDYWHKNKYEYRINA